MVQVKCRLWMEEINNTFLGMWVSSFILKNKSAKRRYCFYEWTSPYTKPTCRGVVENQYK